jgi:hypothetical protein
MDAEADLVPKTPDAAQMALAAYLSLNQPPEGDPRTAVHKAALVAVDVLGKGAQNPTPQRRSPPRRSSPRHERAEDHNLRSTITQQNVDRYREEREDRGDLEYDEDADPIGAPCFSYAIRCTRMPLGFKPPTDVKKYTGAQEPKQWLEDYETSIKLLYGTRTTAMQCLSI